MADKGKGKAKEEFQEFDANGFPTEEAWRSFGQDSLRDQPCLIVLNGHSKAKMEIIADEFYEDMDDTDGYRGLCLHVIPLSLHVDANIGDIRAIEEEIDSFRERDFSIFWYNLEDSGDDRPCWAEKVGLEELSIDDMIEGKDGEFGRKKDELMSGRPLERITGKAVLRELDTSGRSPGSIVLEILDYAFVDVVES